MSANTIRWFVKPAFDEPSLNSPQPCPRGAHCTYKRLNAETNELEDACCRFVHPGEEGTGRRLFPERQLKETGPEGTFRIQPACVRLTASPFYERRSKKMSWAAWCAEKGIPYTPIAEGATWEPVSIERIGAPKTPQRSSKQKLPQLQPKRSSHGSLAVEQWGGEPKQLFHD